MLNILSARYTEAGEGDKSSVCERIAAGILEVFRSAGGKELEAAGYEWIDA